MIAVSNQVVCGGYSTNVGYYFRITFPLGLAATDFQFHTPTDFNMGGVIKVDGKVVVEQVTQEWEEGKQTGFDFNITLDDGNHVLEYLGSQKCCDGTTHWTFKYNSSEWMDFTTANLNKLATTECIKDCDVQPPDPQHPNWAEYHFIQPFPMEYSIILAKTLYWAQDPIKKFPDLETALFMDEPTEGYCVALP